MPASPPKDNPGDDINDAEGNPRTHVIIQLELPCFHPPLTYNSKEGLSDAVEEQTLSPAEHFGDGEDDVPANTKLTVVRKDGRIEDPPKYPAEHSGEEGHQSRSCKFEDVREGGQNILPLRRASERRAVIQSPGRWSTPHP